MPYLPPAPPAAIVRPARPNRLSDLQAQLPVGQAADLQDTLQNERLSPRETSVPVGGPVAPGSEVLLDADSQEYNEDSQVFLARGNVRLRFQKAELFADRLRVDLKARLAVAEGNPRLVQGGQRLTASRIEYNFARGEGVLLNARGTINTKVPETEPNRPLATDLNPALLGNPGDSQYALATVGGVVRFSAERLSLNQENWTAEDLRVTPDQFDPPELEVRTPRATLTAVDSTTKRLKMEGGSLVFDQALSIPTPPYTNVISNQRRKAPNEVGSDSFDKGGFYYQQNFYFDLAKNVELTISPQLYVQQAFSRNFFDAANLGLQSKLSVDWGRGQLTRLFTEINGLRLDDLDNRTRVRVEHITSVANHTVTLSYAYRERFFNGLLGFQTVTSSYGLTVDSPVYNLGNTGIRLTYQGSASVIRAQTDRPGLTSIPELGRYRVAAAVSKTFPLIELDPGPLTREFLRYSIRPVAPGLWLDTGTTFTQSWYSNSETQSILNGYVNLRAVLGRFSRELLDYTALNIGYNSSLVNGSSPFLFDRISSFQQLSVGILQQIYGPVRAGVQTLWDPALGRTVDTYYTLSFDHRTYALTLSYNPVRQTGGIQLRVDEFNWGTNPGGRPDQVTDVVAGVERFNRTGAPGSP